MHLERADRTENCKGNEVKDEADLYTLDGLPGRGNVKAMRCRVKQPSNLGSDRGLNPGPKGWQSSVLPLDYTAHLQTMRETFGKAIL